MVSVVGEAGLGKSRLIHEFKRRLDRDGDVYLEGSCFAYGGTISYLPFIQVIKGVLGLEGITAEAEAKRQIDERLAALALDPAPWRRICRTCWATQWTTRCSGRCRPTWSGSGR